MANGTVTPSNAPTLQSGNDYTLTGNITGNPDGIIVEKSSVTIDGAGYTLNGSGTSAAVGGYGFNLTVVNHVTIKNTRIKNFYVGIAILSFSYNTVSGNNVTNNNWGIELDSSSSNAVLGNNITSNILYGVYLPFFSSYNTVSGNKITNNEWGIYIYHSSSNTVSGNNMTANNEYGIELYSPYNNNTVSGNNVTNNDYGITLSSSASNNTVSGNNITNNSWGFDIYLASNNSIYHNDLVSNTRQVYSEGSINVWDDGYPSGGNYWSDYLTKYPGAAENDSSGFWNTPYVIDTNNNDSYPLMAPFRTFTAGTWNSITYDVGIFSSSTLAGFSFNATAKTITFTVSGQAETTGFCRVAIPTSLLWSEPQDAWTVIVGTNLMGNRTVDVSGNYTYIYFSYIQGTNKVTITGTNAVTVPEFQPFMLTPLFMIITLLGAIILKRKRNVKK